MSDEKLFLDIKELFQTELKLLRAEMHSEFASVRKEMATEFANVRDEMKDEFSEVRKDISILDKRVGNLEEDMKYVKSGIDTLTEIVHNDLVHIGHLKAFANNNKLKYAIK